MPSAFCQPGTHEGTKLTIHAVLGVLAGACAVYNAVAWGYRRKAHLAFNTAFYVTVTALEVKQVHRHFRAWDHS